MGKRENREEIRRDGGRRAPWQASHRNIAALVGSFLAIAPQLGFAQSPTGPQDHSFDAAHSWAQLKAQVDLGPRNPGSEGHLRCKAYLLSELKKSCDNVHVQEFTHQWSNTNQTLTLWNIIGDQNWKDATTRIVLLAHWDTHPISELDPNDDNRLKPTPGANDGASGVAVLLELSRVMRSQLPAGVGVQYVLTDGKDLGPSSVDLYLGATAYAKDIANHPKPNYGIVIDMVGKKNLKISMDSNSSKFAKKLEYGIFFHAAKIGLGDTFPMEFGRQLNDDNMPLIRAGVPSVVLIDFNYFPYWHSLDDTLDKCSADSLGFVGKLLQSWLMQDPPFDFGGSN